MSAKGVQARREKLPFLLPGDLCSRDAPAAFRRAVPFPEPYSHRVLSGRIPAAGFAPPRPRPCIRRACGAVQARIRRALPSRRTGRGRLFLQRLIRFLCPCKKPFACAAPSASSRSDRSCLPDPATDHRRRRPALAFSPGARVRPDGVNPSHRSSERRPRMPSRHCCGRLRPAEQPVKPRKPQPRSVETNLNLHPWDANNPEGYGLGFDRAVVRVASAG